ncbi:MAG TPA: ribosome biogenesis GTPase Der [Dehalococcoidia bacterium]|nr:ribosome biogenesis GTPase Der [Dehalococcoidia bacterium]
MTVQHSPPSPAESGAALPVVAIVGRPNVGKSALFNRLVGGRVALVEDLPGTTRDRIYGSVDWPRRPFRLIDTGGLEDGAAGGYPALIRMQIRRAIDEAAVIVFAVDARDGLTAADLEAAELLRRADRPVVLVANKADNAARRADLAQFYGLGFGEPIAVSAYHDSGIPDLLDALEPYLPAAEAPADAQTLRIAIVGRPNVGKSALLNAILGEERVIVSSVPGTTRDAIDTAFSFEGHELVLVDTAGIRRRGHIDPGVEKHSVLRAQEAIERADVVLAVMDATEMLTAQDGHIIGFAEESLRSLVIVLNKIDLIERVGEWRADLTRLIRRRVKFAPWAEVVFVSARERLGIDELLRDAVAAGEARNGRIGTPRLNQIVKRALVKHSPPAVSGKRLRVFYVTQAETQPPTFVFFVNNPDLVHFSYARYLENCLREAFAFRGTPIKLTFKGRSGAE